MRQRLDQHLLSRGLTETRSRARDLIKRGEVRVDGKVVTKAGMLVGEGNELLVASGANRNVARSGEKLAAGIAHFDLDVTGCVVLDIGASTGGFTQVLLEQGASHVFAVDVGHGQLHPKIKGDPRVSNLEGVDARSLGSCEFDKPITGITADVSFISLRKALPNVLEVAAPGCWIVALVKPQFELERGALSRGGIVKVEQDRTRAVENVIEFLSGSGWHVDGSMLSPIAGKSGNIEHLVVAHRDGG